MFETTRSILKRTLIMNKVQWLLTILLVLTFKGEVQAQDFQMVVNTANPVASISAGDASKLFLKRERKWSHGAAAMAVDQAPDAAVRTAFTRKVHARSVSAVATYWQQQIFAGKDVPPTEKGSDEAVLAFVRANPNAVGYVSADAALGTGVKRLAVH
jgi:ABC-type phosphate transport system substrate-binding protein